MLNLTPQQFNLIFPVSGLVVYGGGVVIKRSCNLMQMGGRHAHLRGEVLLLSRRSLNRLALLIRSCNVEFSSIMTLTYGVNYPHDGRVAKKHLNAFLVAAKRAFGDFEYFWVLEFQRRGAVHFHLATTLDPPDVPHRVVFADIWTRISQEGNWPYSRLLDLPSNLSDGFPHYTAADCRQVHSHSKAWEKVRSKDGMHHYLAKYANKLRQKEVPRHYRNVGRFWGVSRGVRLPKGEEHEAEEEHVRQLLWLQGRDTQKWEFLPKIVLVG